MRIYSLTVSDRLSNYYVNRQTKKKQNQAEEQAAAATAKENQMEK